VLSVTVSVYEKRGLKAGPGITNAVFRTAAPRWVPDSNTFTVTGGVGTPVYQLRIDTMRRIEEADPPFNLEISAGGFHPQSFWVRNGERFEVRLQRV
jgi:hypothetical protein